MFIDFFLNPIEKKCSIEGRLYRLRFQRGGLPRFNSDFYAMRFSGAFPLARRDGLWRSDSSDGRVVLVSSHAPSNLI